MDVTWSVTTPLLILHLVTHSCLNLYLIIFINASHSGLNYFADEKQLYQAP